MEESFVRRYQLSPTGRGIRDLQNNASALRQAIDNFELARNHAALLLTGEASERQGVFAPCVLIDAIV